MSSEPSPATSPDAAGSEPQSAEKPARNPVERIIVWGLIIGLVAVCGGEAMARFGYENSRKSLLKAMEADDQGKALLVEEVESHLSGFPSREHDEQQRIISYHWASPLRIKTYGTIHLSYSTQNEVLSLETAEPPEEEPLPLPEGSEFADAEGGPDMPMTGGPGGGPGAGSPSGGGPGGGGGRGFDPMQFDEDGDGRISRDEAPERMQERFDDIDTNGDGFADAAEFEARRAAFRGGSPDGGGQGGRPDRPQRPDSGDGEASESQPDEEPAEPTAGTSSADGDSTEAGEISDE